MENAGVTSARLDAELLLAYCLKKSREYLLAHSEIAFSKEELAQLHKQLERRAKREPLAYIMGEKEFYGRSFVVSPAVLIPRPESELIIELVKQLPLKKDDIIIDVGTGSGILAITIKLEIPKLTVCATDISRDALITARQNARRLKARVNFSAGDLLKPFKTSFSSQVIVANLPYVDKSWEVSMETNYEPESALFTTDDGLHLIQRLLAQVPPRLGEGGFLVIEADPRQHNNIIFFAKSKGLRPLGVNGFILSFQRA